MTKKKTKKVKGVKGVLLSEPNENARVKKIKRYKSSMHKLKHQLKKIETLKEQKKITPKKIYPIEKCQYVDPITDKQCKRYAVGKEQLCKRHGGDARIRDNYIHEEVQEVLVKNNLEIRKDGAIVSVGIGKKVPFNPNEHPMKMLKLSHEGLSEVEIAAELGVPLYRLQKWAEDYEEFSEAYDLGKALYESWWLKVGKGGLEDSRNFNTPLYKYLTGNKLGYSEKVETKSFNFTAGVLVVPQTSASLDEWEKEGNGVPSSKSEEDIEDAEFSEIKKGKKK